MTPPPEQRSEEARWLEGDHPLIERERKAEAEQRGCEYERDSEYFRGCRASYRFVVARADGDQTFSGGTEHGVYYVCEEHLADAVMGMASGDDVSLTVTIRYDDDASAGKEFSF